jgi:hypothetical protein
MITIKEVNPVYTCSSAPIKNHRLSYPALHDLYKTIKKLSVSLQELQDEDFWKRLIRFIRAYSFHLCSTPLSCNSSVIYDSQKLDSFTEQLRNLNKVYPSHTSLALHALEQMQKIASSKENPIMQSLSLNLNKSSAKNEAALLLLTKRSAILNEVEKEIKSLRLPISKIITDGQLRGVDCYDRLLVAGSCSWFPEFVFNSPRARMIDVFTYKWIKDTWSPKPTFIGSITSIPNSISVGESGENAIDSAEPEEILPTIDWHGVQLAASSSLGSNPHDEEVDSKLLLLDGGYAVFIEASENSKALVLDFDESENDDEADDEEEDSRLKRIHISKLSEGMFILLRTEGSGDLIISIADKLMGEKANEARRKQFEWKSRLYSEVNKTSYLEVCLALLDHGGSKRVYETNLRNWTSERNLRPDDYENFLAIMKLLCLEDKAQEYWQNAAFIEAAHRKAGFHIRRMLIKQVMEVDLDSLQREGRKEFELPDVDGGSLTAFRILAIDPSITKAPSAHIGRVISREDQWQE